MRYMLNNGALYPPIDVLLKLKNIGYDIPCSKKICTITNEIEDCEPTTNSILINTTYISCLSIYEIAQWLNNRYFICVNVYFDKDQLWCYECRWSVGNEEQIAHNEMYINRETALLNGEVKAIAIIETLYRDIEKYKK